MKKRRKAVKKAVTTERSLFFKPAILTSALEIILAIAGISAFAGNALLHESAINHGIEQFNPQKEEQQLTTDVESKHQEMMPIEAKAATNRKEADQLIAQGVESNSDFVYDPWGRLARINEPDGSVRQFLYHEDKICEERDGTSAVTKKFFEWGRITAVQNTHTTETIWVLCEN